MMKIATSLYFNNYIELFHKAICFESTVKSDFIDLKGEVKKLLDKTEKYNLLYVENVNYINLELIESIEYERIELILFLYITIANNLMDFHYTNYDKVNNYENILLTLILKLDFKDYIKISEKLILYKENTLAFGYKFSYFNIKDYNVFNSLKLTHTKTLKNIFKDDNIEIDNYEIILSNISSGMDFYNNYIEENYGSISELFFLYKKDIRIYFLSAPNGGKSTYKLLSYFNSNTAKLSVYNKYINFSSRIGNVEEVNKTVIFNLYGIFDNDDKNILHKFSKNSIHYELINIYIQTANENEIFELLKYIFKLKFLNCEYYDNEFRIKVDNDIYTFFISKKLDVEIVKERYVKGEKAIFLSNPDKTITDYIGRENISFINSYIQYHNLFDAIHYFIKDKIKHLKSIDFKPNAYIENLIKSIKSCPNGREGWSEFEKIGVEIFKLLFEDSFRTFSFDEQSITFDKIFRRDLIVNNLPYNNQSFWNDIKNDYKANVCIIEFKNYSEPLNSSTLYDVSKYTSPQTGNFILIFSRYGIDSSAKELQRKLLKDRNILILVLDEKDLIDMINEKVLNIDINYRLDNLKFEILKAL